MKLAAICCTYKRPAQLAESIECFLRQDYPIERRELVVLDDAGQYADQQGKGWRLVSLGVRFRTLGEKRNASAALVSSDVEGYCVWDDDDMTTFISPGT
jgi:glycosyltransferase involved in cell wall biosynthesis